MAKKADDDCIITEFMIISDIVMCVFFIGVIIVDFFVHNRVEKYCFKKNQTVQEYSVVVTNPPNSWTGLLDDWRGT